MPGELVEEMEELVALLLKSGPLRKEAGQTMPINVLAPSGVQGAREGALEWLER